MSLKTKIKKSKYVLFLLFIFSLLHTLSMSYIASDNAQVEGLLTFTQYIIYALLLCVVLFERYKIKTFLVFVFIIALGLLIYVNAGSAFFLTVPLVIMSCRSVRFYEVCKSFLYGMIWGTLVIFLMYLLGISDAGVLRRGAVSFGFSHPNRLALVVSTIVLLSIYLIEVRKKQKNKIVSIESLLLLLVGFLINYFILSSRTASIVLLLYIPIRHFMHSLLSKEKIPKIAFIVLMALPFLLEYLMFYGAMNYKQNLFWTGFNELINWRLYYGNYNFTTYGTTLLGQRVDFYRLDGLYNASDVAYMTALILDGIVGTLLLLSLYSFVIYRLLKDRQGTLCTIIIVILLTGITENFMLDIVASFPLIYLIKDLPRQEVVDRKLRNSLT